MNARDLLALRLGIADGYHDNWGRHHPLSEGTRDALLAALGQGAQPADDTLAALDAAVWSDALAPVIVATADDGAPRVELVVDAAQAEAVHWRVVLESGETRTGVARDTTLIELARAAPEADARRRVRMTLEQIPHGYHRLALLDAEGGRERATTSLIVCPRTCHRPDDIVPGLRVWGPAIQLYAIRSGRNWGVGDFGDLRRLVDIAADAGAGVVGLNPLHALFLHAPQDASPYGPSDRMRLNVWMIDVEALPEVRDTPALRAALEAPDFATRVRALREAPYVDYEGVAALKRPMLEAAYRVFVETHRAHDTSHARAFDTWCAEAGEMFRRFALYDAIQAHLHAQDASIWGWPRWPKALRDVDSPAVAAFAREHAHAVDFHRWLQWHADTQLADAAAQARARGMPVGLYRDLAVGVAAHGAETWSAPTLYALGARVGAPPDEFNPQGQDWGLPPQVPQRLAQEAYAPFVTLLRANMRHAGALRIDHVMVLARLFCIPLGRPADEGAYLTYPLEDLAAIVALESRRARCLIVGEDLGTVPPPLREAMHARGMLSYRPVYFERDEHGRQRLPHEVLREALVTVGTHDLPTWIGYWTESDLAMRDRLALFPSPEIAKRSRDERTHARTALVEGLRAAGFEAEDPEDPSRSTPPAVADVHAFVARTKAALLAFQLEDVFGMTEQINVPGTTESKHPNWRRKLPVALEEWARDPAFAAVTEAIRRERGPAPGLVDGPAPRAAVIPRATYRLQLHAGFGFDRACEVVPYLARLGASHAYVSPIMRARPGSLHGYDVVDHDMLNPELGPPEAFERLCATLAAHGMGLLVDIVPNHMGVIGAVNPWWHDVLEHGVASRYARHFDIDWSPGNPLLEGKVLIPVLGEQYGAVLDRGELRLAFDPEGGNFEVAYYDHRFPVDLRTLAPWWESLDETIAQQVSADARDAWVRWRSACASLPARNATPVPQRLRRATESGRLRAALADLVRSIAGLGEALVRATEQLAARRPDPSGAPPIFNALLDAQAYRLAHWRVASDDINYRRFFDINDLAAMRMQTPGVFEDIHRHVLGLVQRGCVQGLRIDHPDGLSDPGAYFAALQRRSGAASASQTPLYVVIEKILAEHERLPDEWPVHGETGYRFLNLVTGVLVDANAADRIERVYAGFTDERTPYAEVLAQSKRMILTQSLSSEFALLGQLLHGIARADAHTRDFTLNALRAALVEAIAAFPVYRTYIVGPDSSVVDQRLVDWALTVAAKRARHLDASLFDFLRDVLIGERASEAARTVRDAFVRRFQQVTAPVTAKAMEDTAFYRYVPLVALNEVGGDPSHMGVSVSAFHKAMQERAGRWPHALSASSTHDTKRGEDVRARIAVLSEMPARWRLALRRFARMNARRKTVIDGRAAPSANDEYLLYQTLLGAWPGGTGGADRETLEAFRARIDAYMLKAVREAKVHTSWVRPDESYERALADFIGAILDPAPRNRFLAALEAEARLIARFGVVNGLTQTLVKCTAPGVPDVYQGAEGWNLSLVDPDNRRPVDYTAAQDLLASVATATPEAVTGWYASPDDGRIKRHVLRAALADRRLRPDLYARGEYVPIQARGVRQEHALVFARTLFGDVALVVATRLPLKLAEVPSAPPLGAVWADTTIAPPALDGVRCWRDLLTDTRIDAAPTLALAEVLVRLPVALLVPEFG